MKTRTVRIKGVRDIEIPVTTERKAIGSNAPHYQVLNNRLTQVALDVGALETVLDGLGDPSSILDMLGGCGFSGAVLSTAFPSAHLSLNDVDPVCTEVLRLNFPRATVHNRDIKTWEELPAADLIWIDFNNFTLKRLPEWREVLARAGTRSTTLLFTDCACYGFHMGNLKAYGAATPLDYYKTLSNSLSFTGKYVRRVVRFGGAALVLLEESPGPIRLEDGVDPAVITFAPQLEGLFSNSAHQK